MLDAVARASALIFPSLAEGFGLPVLEALALGTPVVASNIPSIRSWAGDAATYFDPHDPETWSAAIQTATRASTEMRREGQRLALGYRWSACAASVTNF